MYCKVSGFCGSHVVDMTGRLQCNHPSCEACPHASKSKTKIIFPNISMRPSEFTGGHYVQVFSNGSVILVHGPFSSVDVAIAKIEEYKIKGVPRGR